MPAGLTDQPRFIRPLQLPALCRQLDALVHAMQPNEVQRLE